MYAPIVLFTYNRKWHTEQTINALLKNNECNESIMYIYSDGAKESDLNEVNEVREYLKTIKGFKQIHIVERDENIGLADSIIDGVSEVVNRHGKVIVLEDDMITSPYFLKYMNDGLNYYEHNDKVISISGYFMDIQGLPETFFMKWADCWGWATWKRGWSLFEKDAQKLLNSIKNNNLEYKFDINGSYPYTKMLEDTIKTNKSWAIRWYASAFLSDKLTLCPGQSLIENIGTDGTGTNYKDKDSLLDVKINYNCVNISNIPVKHSNLAYSKLTSFYNRNLNKKETVMNKIHKELERFKNKVKKKNKKYGFLGPYQSWQEASKNSSGYDTSIILEKVKNALLKVKNGEAVYERDSCIFDKIEYSWPLTSALMMLAAKNNGELNIIDFGGSLGSSYYQNRKFLFELNKVTWNIIEQKHYLEAGKNYFEDNTLKFHFSIEDCMKSSKPNAILFSGVLPYLEKPYEILDKAMSNNFEYIIIDRTSFVNSPDDIITVQKVPPEIFDASYPCWFFSYSKLKNHLNANYELIEEFDGFDVADDLPNSMFKGLIYKKRVINGIK